MKQTPSHLITDMNSTPHPTPRYRRLLSLLLPLLGVLLAGWLCFYPLQYIAIVVSAPWVAQTLAPPPYPNSVLLSERQFAQGDSGFAIQRTYYTGDEMDQILLYMAAYMEALAPMEIEGEGEGYMGRREARDWWGQQLVEMSCSSLYCRSTREIWYPQFTLYLSPAADGIGTQIEYEFAYPAP